MTEKIIYGRCVFCGRFLTRSKFCANCGIDTHD